MRIRPHRLVLGLTMVLLGTTLVADPAFAGKKNSGNAFAECPWEGSPMIEDFSPNSITVAGYKFKFGKAKSLFEFQTVLNLCNAGSAIPALAEWRRAHAMVMAKSASAAAYAAQATMRALNAESAEEREAIAREAAETAAQFASEIAPLAAEASAKKQMFLAALQTTST